MFRTTKMGPDMSRQARTEKGQDPERPIRTFDAKKSVRTGEDRKGQDRTGQERRSKMTVKTTVPAESQSCLNRREIILDLMDRN